MSNIFSVFAGSGFSSLLGQLSANLTRDMLGADDQLSQSLSGMIGSGISSLSQSAFRGKTSARDMLTALSRAESRPIGQLTGLSRDSRGTTGSRHNEGRGTTGGQTKTQYSQTADNRYYQTQSQMFVALIRALNQGQRNC